MLKRGRVLISAFAVFASVVLVAIDPGIAQGQAGPFCDGFEDGSAIPSQWTVYQGYQTLVGSPTHSGDSSLEFHGGCHSSIYRTGFEAGYGEYSVWVNQQHSTGHFSVYTQFAVGSSPDPNPIGHIGYQLSLSATNSDGNQFYVNRDSNGVETRLGTGIGQFVLGEWIRVFVRRLPYGVIVAGYERTAGLPLRDSLICFDPNPLTAPGKFLLWACSDVAPYTYFDDACYAAPECPSEAAPCAFEAEDTNCDGHVDVFDILDAIAVAFSGKTPHGPCCRFQ